MTTPKPFKFYVLEVEGDEYVTSDAEDGYEGGINQILKDYLAGKTKFENFEVYMRLFEFSTNEDMETAKSAMRMAMDLVHTTTRMIWIME
jgi:hypothetical protein